MEGTGETIDKWEVDEMMNDGDKNQDGMLDYEGEPMTRWIILPLVPRLATTPIGGSSWPAPIFSNCWTIEFFVCAEKHHFSYLDLH